MGLLTEIELRQLEDISIAIGLVSNERRELLFQYFPMTFLQTLRVYSRPLDQLRADLHELNETPSIIGMNLPPLEVWIENAISLSGGRKEGESLKRLKHLIEVRTREVRHQESDPEGYIELRSRRELVQASLGLLTKPTQSYRSAIVGPLFLHPIWYRERRNRKVQLPDYDEKLAEYIMNWGRERTHNIRLIFTFSERYKAKVETYVKQQERAKFQEETLAAIELLWGSLGEKGPDLCCVHPGFLHIQTIFDDALIATYRPSQLTPTAGGYLSYSSDVVRRERSRFDTIFDASSQGQEQELETLRSKIKSLW